MKKIGFIVFCLLISFSINAQKKYQPKGGVYKGKKSKVRTASTHLKRRPTDVFPLDLNYNLNGWFGSLGATYMIPWRDGEGGDGTRVISNDTTFESQGRYTGEPSGKIGAYVDLGFFHSFQRPWLGIFHFYEVGLSYKWYRGEEAFTGILKNDILDTNNLLIASTREELNYNYTYSDHVGSLVAKITNHWHFSEKGFLQNSLGLNADYFFLKSRSGTNGFPGYEPEFPEDFQAQFNFRFGIGWKASRNILIIPSVEMPILTVYPYDGFRSSLPYFSSKHIPLIVSIRVMILRKISEDCNVPNYDGPANFQ